VDLLPPFAGGAGPAVKCEINHARTLFPLSVDAARLTS
jgi:hypothetical protein